jgi:hypothetical protein
LRIQEVKSLADSDSNLVGYQITVMGQATTRNHLDLSGDATDSLKLVGESLATVFSRRTLQPDKRRSQGPLRIRNVRIARDHHELRKPF